MYLTSEKKEEILILEEEKPIVSDVQFCIQLASVEKELELVTLERDNFEEMYR